MAARKLLAIIPARGGSKRIPGKNLIDLGGRPLIQWTLDAALGCSLVDHILVSSDSEQILKACARPSRVQLHKRSEDLAGDFATSVDVVLDALKVAGAGFTDVLLLQPTSPFRTGAHIEAAIKKFHSEGKPFLVSAKRAEENPFHMIAADENGNHGFILSGSNNTYLRSQDIPKVYVLNGAIYLAKTEAFIAERKFVGSQTGVFEMDSESSLDIDTFEDLEKVKRVLAKNSK